MAKIVFESLYDYSDQLAASYRASGNMAYVYALADYYEALARIRKVKTQRDHARNMLFEINPAFAKGYFERAKSKS